mmetsp:Transcript_13573/g.21188  ORF Transcript_13573/g.21188 Transcript_13573/m.21188 type:complete len:122 (-) Transcript_13573:33-398(-)
MVLHGWDKDPSKKKPYVATAISLFLSFFLSRPAYQIIFTLLTIVPFGMGTHFSMLVAEMGWFNTIFGLSLLLLMAAQFVLNMHWFHKMIKAIVKLLTRTDDDSFKKIEANIDVDPEQPQDE